MVEMVWLMGVLCIGVELSSASNIIVPTSYTIGNTPSLEATTPYTGDRITLTPSNPVATIDYGAEVAGTPVLNISSLSEPAQIEFTFSEEFSGLENIHGDGTWTFSNGLSNTFRTEAFEIKELGQLRSYFVQGGQRWQSIRLLTNGTIGISSIGFEPEVVALDDKELPGSFNSSNCLYNDIWSLGARAVQLSCIDNGSLRSTWEVTDDGALIHGQQTAQTYVGIDFSNYTMSFSSKIVTGGTGWRVATPVSSYGPYFVLTTNYTSNSTFANTLSSLLPPNSLVVGYGWGLVNVTTLPTGPVESYPLSIPIHENEWYEISTSISPEGFVITINNSTIATISYAEGLALAGSRFGPSSVTSGSWGFGPYQDQIAYVKDVKVLGSNGTTLYENTMTSPDILVEYGVASNDASVCLDGPKRDRLVWIGDFVHTARELGVSTNRLDFITGTMEYEFTRQITSGVGEGYVPTQGAMGVRAQNKDAYYPRQYSITDYQIFFLVTIGDYYQMSGDLATAAKYWNQTKLLTTAMLELIDPVSGLVAGESFFFTGPTNGTAASALMTLALRQLVPIASAIGDSVTASQYTTVADSLATNINDKLWNDELGFYSLSTTSPGNFSAAGIAFAIRAGISNSTQTARSIAALPALKYGVGYVSDTTVVRNNETQISPNILGFLLESLFIANATFGTPLDVAKDLLDNTWSKMVTQNAYFTGASWEYLYPDGSPGIGLFTSLAHPWGGAPTYILPHYVLGVSALSPGYSRWRFAPSIHGLGLDSASGAIPTPHGEITASWSFADRKLEMNISAPTGTVGVTKLPFLPSLLSVCGKEVTGVENLEVKGGGLVDVVAYL